MNQHMGLSYRTGNILARPPKSSIREHTFICGNPINKEKFTVIDREEEDYSLRILETLHIKRIKPNINECNTAVPTLIG